MPIRKAGKKQVFQGINASEHTRLVNAAKNRSNITYDQIANSSGLSRAKVIEFVHKLGLRPKGNNLDNRLIKQPRTHARVEARKENMRKFIRMRLRVGGLPTINEIQEECGGEKKLAKLILEEF